MEDSAANDKSAEVEASEMFCPSHLLPLRTRAAYSVGHVLNDLCASMWFTYLVLYFTMVQQFESRLAGALLLVGQVADGLSTPFVGIESDRDDDFWMCRYGRRKTWHLVGTVCVAGSFPFLFTKCLAGSAAAQTSQFVYYAAFIVVFQFGWASTQVSHLSLIPDLTPISRERVELNSLRYAFTVASNIVVYTITWLVLGISGDARDASVGPMDAHVFQKVVFIIVGIGVVFSVIFHLFVRDPSVKRRNSSMVRRNEYLSDLILDKSQHLRWRDWFRERDFYLVGMLYMATRLYVNLSQVFITMYLQDTLKLHRRSIAIIPLVMYISGFFSSFAVKYASRRIGTKNVYTVGCILGIAAALWIFLGQDSPLYAQYEIYAIAVVIGMAGTTMLITSLAITNDLIGGHTSSGAFVFGAMSFLDKLGNGVVGFIIQEMHSCKMCGVHYRSYYQYVMTFACGGSAVLGLVLSFAICWVGNLASPERVGISTRRARKGEEEETHGNDASPLLEDGKCL